MQRLVAVESTGDPILGMFAQEPDLMDTVISAAMDTRETNPLRLPVG